MFYVNINGQQRLVKFGARNENGVSNFETLLPSTAEAIRRHSLFKRGVIHEHERPQEKKEAPKPIVKPTAEINTATPMPAVSDNAVDIPDNKKDDTEEIKAVNFTQAKSILSKRLGIKFSDIKTPDQLKQLAKDNNITIVFGK